MIISKKNVRNPAQYLYDFSPEEPLYITAPVSAEKKEVLLRYGFSLSRTTAQHRIPIPRKSATKRNAEGHWIIHKDRPKEPRTFEREYHVVDWHGADHYGICFQTRDCYPRTLIPPTELVFTLENGTMFSPLLYNNEDNYGIIKLSMNVLLEMFGQCEMWTERKIPAVPPVSQKVVPWEILRSGKSERNDWEQYINETIKVIHKKYKVIIKQRHEYLWSKKPDFCVLGSQNFWGYVVYGFLDKNLFIFECNRPDNATYVFRGNWESASRLTKTQILCGDLQEARLFHTEKWRDNLGALLLTVERKAI